MVDSFIGISTVEDPTKCQRRNQQKQINTSSNVFWNEVQNPGGDDAVANDPKVSHNTLETG